MSNPILPSALWVSRRNPLGGVPPASPAEIEGFLGGVAEDALRNQDLAHMAERLRDLAALAQDSCEPSLELDVFRLQLRLYSK